MSQDDHIRATPLQDVTAPDNEQQPVGPKNQKKRTRLLLDARTELTDEELKVGLQFKALERMTNNIVGCKGPISRVPERIETRFAEEEI